MSKPKLLLLPLLLLAGISSAWAMQAGNPGRKTVWQGVFTAEQAVRGMETFEANCRSCHNRADDFAGAEAQALKGEVFFDRWREDSLQSLFNKMKSSMPPAKPRLADGEYADVIAFLLSENAFPAGTQQLKSSDLENIRIEGREGPAPLPNLSIVKVIGCLTPAANNTWNLTNGTDPVRTRQPDESNAEEIQLAKATPLGSQTFQLRALENVGNLNPDSHKGDKVQAKGVIYLNQTPNRLSIISIEAVGASCGQ